jgi:hypothetical protein
LSVIDLQHEQQAQVEEIEKVETVVFLLQYSNVGPAPNFFDLSMQSPIKKLNTMGLYDKTIFASGSTNSIKSRISINRLYLA